MKKWIRQCLQSFFFPYNANAPTGSKGLRNYVRAGPGVGRERFVR